MQMENNKKRWMLTFVYVCTAMFAFAQSASPAKEISKIKQSKLYLWAEATDSTEQAAYQVAKRELDNLVDEHIASSKIADGAKNIIVQNIASKTSSVKMLRGILHRVFVYVKKTDIVKSTGDVDVYEVTPSVASSEKAKDAKAKEEKPKDVKSKGEKSKGAKAAADNETDELLSAIENVQEPLAQLTEPKVEAPQPVEQKVEAPQPVEQKVEAPQPVEQKVEVPQPVEQKVEAPQPVEQKVEVPQPVEQKVESPQPETSSYLASLPEGRRQILTLLLDAQSVDEANSILGKQYQLQYVKNYGKASTCKNQNRCYWVFERDGQIVVLTPLKTNGVRINVRTGAQEQLPGFNSNMVWFAM